MVDTCTEYNISAHNLKVLLADHNIALHDKDITEKLGKAKQKANLQAKYGVDNVFQLDCVKKKSFDTKTRLYNDGCFTNRQKASETCLEKYGASTYLGSNSAKDVFMQSALARTERFLAGLPDSQNLFKLCYDDRELTLATIKSLEHSTTSQLAAKLNITRNLAYSLISRLDLFEYIDLETTNSSYCEEELTEFIGQDLCINNDRTVLDGKEIDIYIPSKKIGIEFNGTYWHSNLYKDKNYHFEKSKLAESRGIRLIHIWEYEWMDPTQQEKIKMLLNIALDRVPQKIYARQCTIRQIGNKEAKILNNSVHLQNHRDAAVTYGLYYKDELVQLMSFSKTKYNKNLKTDNSWEIIRGCPGSNNLVVGGVSKLFSHFIKDYQPEYVFSYCDFNKFNGKSYEQLGMEFIGYTGPDMKWLMPDGTVVNRKPKHHAELKEIAKAQLFGAGSKKYLWAANNTDNLT